MGMEMDGEDFHDLNQEWDLLDTPSGLVQHGSMASMPLETPLDVSMLRQESFGTLLRSMSDSDQFLLNREESDLTSWVDKHEECITSGAGLAQPFPALPCVEECIASGGGAMAQPVLQVPCVWAQLCEKV